MPMTMQNQAVNPGSRSIGTWISSLLLCFTLAACQTPPPPVYVPPPLPERPAPPTAAVAFDQAIDFAVDDLLIQAQRLPEFQPKAPSAPGAAPTKAPTDTKIRIVVDNALDGQTGQQTVATRTLDERLLSRVTARFPEFQVSPISAGELASARFILTTTVTVLNQSQAGASIYRVNFALTDGRSGIVVAMAAAQATGETVDITPTNFYRDSPSMVKDRTMEGQIRTAKTPAGDAADGVYMSSLSVASLIAEGSRLYDAANYQEALAVYESAAARPDGKHMRVLNGLYLSNVQLGRLDAAEQAFARIVQLGLATNALSIKFLFKPSSTDFWPDPKISGPYPMWLRVVARESIGTKSCITIVGHSSHTGSEESNDRLSLQRAVSIEKRLIGVTPDIGRQLQTSGVGFRENLIGTGTDDARDALDRRVEFRVRGC